MPGRLPVWDAPAISVNEALVAVPKNELPAKLRMESSALNYFGVLSGELKL